MRNDLRNNLRLPAFKQSPAHSKRGGALMGRYLLLWLLGIPLPILVLIYAFGGLR
jgi:hypothetical protein